MCNFHSHRNICGTADLGCGFTREEFVLVVLGALDDDNVINANYDEDKFAIGIHIWIKEPKTTAAIFTTGKCNILGAKTEVEAEAAAQEIAHLLVRLGKVVNVSLLWLLYTLVFF